MEPPFKILIFQNQYLEMILLTCFSYIDKDARNQKIMQKWSKPITDTVWKKIRWNKFYTKRVEKRYSPCISFAAFTSS